MKGDRLKNSGRLLTEDKNEIAPASKIITVSCYGFETTSFLSPFLFFSQIFGKLMFLLSFSPLYLREIRHILNIITCVNIYVSIENRYCCYGFFR